MEEQRIYVVVAGAVKCLSRQVVQPPGRQIAQACHVVSKLRQAEYIKGKAWYELFMPITTIILQARDSAELRHVQTLLLSKRKLDAPTVFFDTNEPVYGPGEVMTAIAILATKKQTIGILDYLPMWDAN